MIIYNKKDIDNYIARKDALPPGDDTGRNDVAWKEFALRFPYPFYSPHFFIRLGLFLLTSLTIVLTTALLWLMSGMGGYSLLFIVVGTGCVLFSEYVALQRKHFQSGVDEALHLMAALFVPFGLFGMLGLLWWMIPGLVAVFSSLLFLRYMNVWMAGLAVVCSMIFLSEFLSLFLPVFVYALPLSAVAMAGSYFSGERFSKKQRYYETGFLFARYLFLLSACFFTNYLCVSMLSGNRFSTFAELNMYKVTTILIPIGLLLYGFRKRDKVPMHVGMIALFPMVYTVFTFLKASHPFVWMTVFGALMVIVTVAAIRWLKVARLGFIYQPVKKPPSAAWLEVLASVNAPQAGNSSDHLKFGGGDFGGGGASGSF